MSEDLRQALIFGAIALILAFALAFVDREDHREPEDPDEPQVFEEDEFDQ